MKAIEFPQQHDILAKDQPEYLPLPVHYKTEPVKFKDADGNEVVKDVVMEVTACFQLEAEEIAQVIATGELYYTQCVYGQKFQPVRMSVINPFEPAPSEYHNHDNKNYGLPVEVVQTIRHAFLEISQDSYTNDGTNYSELVENALMYISNNLKPKNEHTQAAPEQSPITRLVEALNNDPEYREGWKGNIAAAFVNSYKGLRLAGKGDIKNDVLYDIANHAANNFLNLLCAEGTKKVHESRQAEPVEGWVYVNNNSDAFREWAIMRSYSIHEAEHQTGVYLPEGETLGQLLKEWNAYERANNPKYKNP